VGSVLVCDYHWTTIALGLMLSVLANSLGFCLRVTKQAELPRCHRIGRSPATVALLTVPLLLGKTVQEGFRCKGFASGAGI